MARPRRGGPGWERRLPAPRLPAGSRHGRSGRRVPVAGGCRPSARGSALLTAGGGGGGRPQCHASALRLPASASGAGDSAAAFPKA